jgi:hypothetical protein
VTRNLHQMFLSRHKHENWKPRINVKPLPFFYHCTCYLVCSLMRFFWALFSSTRVWKVILDPWEQNKAFLKACTVPFTANDAQLPTPEKLRNLPHIIRENSVTSTDTRDKPWQRNCLCSFLLVNIRALCSRTKVLASIRDWFWSYWHWKVWVSPYYFLRSFVGFVISL